MYNYSFIHYRYDNNYNKFVKFAYGSQQYSSINIYSYISAIGYYKNLFVVAYHDT